MHMHMHTEKGFILEGQSALKIKGVMKAERSCLNIYVC